MTSITKGNQFNVNYQDVVYNIRNTEEFEIETFSLPDHQEFPKDHFEVKTFCVIGAIASGKSTIAERYFANRILDLWNDESLDNPYDNGNSVVGCYKAKDLFATIQTVMEDKRLVKYIIIDDSAPLFDSRRSSSSNNVDVTQFYWEIRHELEDHAKKSGNAGGLVIICLIIQDFRALDLRIRNALAFRIYKTWDRSVAKLKLDEKIDKLLLQMYDKCVRVCDYFFRSLGVAVDIMKKYTLFMANVKTLPEVKFKVVNGTGIFERQRDILISQLVDKISVEMSKDRIKAILFGLWDNLKKSEKKIRITKTDFQEIIVRAKGILYEREDEDEENDEENELIPNSRTDRQIKLPIIVRLREEKAMSFEDISSLVSVPQTTVKRWYHSYSENRNKDISISELVLIELKSRIKPVALMTCQLEQLKIWIEKYVNPQLYFGSDVALDSMASVIYRLIQNELKQSNEQFIKNLEKGD